MMISDELLEEMADEFVRLRLDLNGITLDQFINAPDICRDTAALRDRQKLKATTGRADEPMKHARHPRKFNKSKFIPRAQS